MHERDASERVVAFAESGYPHALRHVHQPPRCLHVRGAMARDPTSLSAPSIAVVGARDATAYGLAIARELARGLAEAGLTVVSGLALGIDGAAHRGALEAGGPTIAVAGTGTDVVYPRQHRGLRDEILRTGAVVSEYDLGTPPRPGQFPLRNRIISGLALGVVVVEASLRSGSLSTARHALEQGREVFAVPGPVNAVRSAGPHALLRAGARLVETVDDILAELPAGVTTPAARPGQVRRDVPPAMAALLDGIAAGAVTADALALRCGSKIAETLKDLLALELRGLVVRGPGGRYALTAGSMATGTTHAGAGVDSPGRDR